MKFSKKALARMIALPFIIFSGFCISMQPSHWISRLDLPNQQGFFFGIGFLLTAVVLYYVLVYHIVRQCVEQSERLKWIIFMLCMLALMLGTAFLFYVLPFV